MMSGKDVIGLAQTGTGKTLAYLLPMLSLWKFSKEPHPQILIIVPTRELVVQVVREVEKLFQVIDDVCRQGMTLLLVDQMAGLALALAIRHPERVRRLVLTGLSADSCVLATAQGANMREYAVWVPQDAVAGLLAVVVICTLSSLVAIRAALRVDPAEAIGG